jgi:hypothetical protein
MTRLASTGNTIDLSGIDDHTVRNLELVQAGGVTQTPQGDIIIIINQTAWMPDGRTIISTGQLEHFKVRVDKRSKHVTGKTMTTFCFLISLIISILAAYKDSS